MYRSILIRLSAGAILAALAPQAMAQIKHRARNIGAPRSRCDNHRQEQQIEHQRPHGVAVGGTKGAAKTTTVKSSKSNTSDRMGGGGGGPKNRTKTAADKEPLERAINLNSSKSNKY